MGSKIEQANFGGHGQQNPFGGGSGFGPGGGGFPQGGNFLQWFLENCHRSHA